MQNIGMQKPGKRESEKHIKVLLTEFSILDEVSGGIKVKWFWALKWNVNIKDTVITTGKYIVTSHIQLKHKELGDKRNK